jgi:DNA mismatch endonuclease, patch repair protein
MQMIRSQNTKPELRVRRLLFNKGYRYRVNATICPGKPDIMFPRKKKIIFVHGCFWHQHNDPLCPLKHVPQSRQTYWLPKLTRTIERDAVNLSKLQQLGWDVMVIWECQVDDLLQLAKRIDEFLGEPLS